MKWLRRVILFCLPAVGLPLLGIWWAAWLAGAAVGFFMLISDMRKNLLFGFIMGFTVWAFWSLLLWMDGGGLISDKMSALLSLPNGLILILVSSVLNGILGMLGIGLGSALRRLIRGK